ncbi:hypothetical protein NDU88_001624 [Pleurodeles waltl]|uniref:Uncharacterized protein n=1 Tax=Pleurodeles waltl TaxID=8319 RepID=A0AAV7UTV3_PLEWA|nr:hypothetical protein NDU88_001624 [Pleurodeles waltl]
MRTRARPATHYSQHSCLRAAVTSQIVGTRRPYGPSGVPHRTALHYLSPGSAHVSTAAPASNTGRSILIAITSGAVHATAPGTPPNVSGMPAPSYTAHFTRGGLDTDK